MSPENNLLISLELKRAMLNPTEIFELPYGGLFSWVAKFSATTFCTHKFSAPAINSIYCCLGKALFCYCTLLTVSYRFTGSLSKLHVLHVLIHKVNSEYSLSLCQQKDW